MDDLMGRSFAHKISRARHTDRLLHLQESPALMVGFGTACRELNREISQL